MSWTCSKCTLNNEETASECAICSNRRFQNNAGGNNEKGMNNEWNIAKGKKGSGIQNNNNVSAKTNADLGVARQPVSGLIMPKPGSQNKKKNMKQNSPVKKVICSTCTLENDVSLSYCDVCMSPLPLPGQNFIHSDNNSSEQPLEEEEFQVVKSKKHNNPSSNLQSIFQDPGIAPVPVVKRPVPLNPSNFNTSSISSSMSKQTVVSSSLSSNLNDYSTSSSLSRNQQRNINTNTSSPSWSKVANHNTSNNRRFSNTATSSISTSTNNDYANKNDIGNIINDKQVSHSSNNDTTMWSTVPLKSKRNNEQTRQQETDNILSSTIGDITNDVTSNEQLKNNSQNVTYASMVAASGNNNTNTKIVSLNPQSYLHSARQAADSELEINNTSSTKTTLPNPEKTYASTVSQLNVSRSRSFKKFNNDDAIFQLDTDASSATNAIDKSKNTNDTQTAQQASQVHSAWGVGNVIELIRGNNSSKNSETETNAISQPTTKKDDKNFLIENYIDKGKTNNSAVTDQTTTNVLSRDVPVDNNAQNAASSYAGLVSKQQAPISDPETEKSSANSNRSLSPGLFKKTSSHKDLTTYENQFESTAPNAIPPPKRFQPPSSMNNLPGSEIGTVKDTNRKSDKQSNSIPITDNTAGIMNRNNKVGNLTSALNQTTDSSIPQPTPIDPPSHTPKDTNDFQRKLSGNRFVPPSQIPPETSFHMPPGNLAYSMPPPYHQAPMGGFPRGFNPSEVMLPSEALMGGVSPIFPSWGSPTGAGSSSSLGGAAAGFGPPPPTPFEMMNGGYPLYQDITMNNPATQPALVEQNSPSIPSNPPGLVAGSSNNSNIYAEIADFIHQLNPFRVVITYSDNVFSLLSQELKYQTGKYD